MPTLLNPYMSFGGDPSSLVPPFANVAMLLHMDGSNGSTTIVDSSSHARSPASVSGDAALDTGTVKWGTASLKSDTLVARVNYADQADWNLTNEFTIEAWNKPTNMTDGNLGGIVAQWSGVNGGCNFQLHLFRTSSTSKSYRLNYSAAGTTAATSIAQAATNIDMSIWHHVAASRDASNKIRLFVDGVMVASATVSGATDVSTQLTVACSIAGGGNRMRGWIDDLRICKGFCCYPLDTGLTVPTGPFPNS